MFTLATPPRVLQVQALGVFLRCRSDLAIPWHKWLPLAHGLKTEIFPVPMGQGLVPPASNFILPLLPSRPPPGTLLCSSHWFCSGPLTPASGSLMWNRSVSLCFCLRILAQASILWEISSDYLSCPSLPQVRPLSSIFSGHSGYFILMCTKCCIYFANIWLIFTSSSRL